MLASWRLRTSYCSRTRTLACLTGVVVGSHLLRGPDHLSYVEGRKQHELGS